MEKRKGFTLIELLVVVLIIGILAAVALPQYQKAVQKTRLFTLLPLMKALKNAQHAYFIENGEYASNLSELAVDFNASQTSALQGHAYTNLYYLNSSTYLEMMYKSEHVGRADPFIAAHIIKLPVYIWTALETDTWRCYPTATNGIPICRQLGCTGTILVNAGGCGFSPGH